MGGAAALLLELASPQRALDLTSARLFRGCAGMLAACCALPAANLPRIAPSPISGLHAARQLRPPAQAPAMQPIGEPRVRFEENRGQFPAPVLFAARAHTYDFFLTPDAVTIVLRRDERRYALRLKLEGARLTPWETRGVQPAQAPVHYFRGAEVIGGVRRFERLHADLVAPGIDWTFYGRGGDVEYDLILHPPANPARVRFVYEGARGMRVDGAGHLVVDTPLGPFVQRKPRVLQWRPEGPHEVEAAYHVVGMAAGLLVAAYDPARPLVIDPQLTYASYLGGASVEVAYGLAIDAAGAWYVTGETLSADFPVQTGFQTDRPDRDAFVTKFHPSGASLVYSTYLGGASIDSGRAIAVDEAGHAFVTGYTFSIDFPTANPYQTDRPGYDAFVTKLSPAGNTLVYSTYLGGSGADYGWDLALDSGGRAYVTGYTYSTNFPTLNHFQTEPGDSNADAFAAKFTPQGNALVYSTYLGGNRWDAATSIAVDPPGNAYVAGKTDSTNFPLAGPLHGDRGLRDGFVVKLAPEGGAPLFSTYLGGSEYDEIQDIAVDPDGAVYVAGQTYSTDFPLLNPLRGDPGDRDADAFAAKLHPSGSALLFSTYLGGAKSDSAQAIAVDASRSVHVTGWTESPDFPLLHPSQHSLAGALDAFVVKLSPSGSVFAYATYFGGSGLDQSLALALDGAGRAVIAGTTNSRDLPLFTPYKSQPDLASSEAFLARFVDDAPPSNAITIQSVPGGRLFEILGAGCQAGAGYRTPQIFTWVPGAACTVAFASPDPGEPGTQFVFASWTDGGAANPRVIVAPTTGETYIAQFQTQHRLLTSAHPPDGGTVSLPSGAFYNAGSAVTVSATPQACYSFLGWSPNVLDGRVVLHQPETVVATFQNNTAPNVTAQFSLQGGGFRFNRATNRFVQSVTLTNLGGAVGALAFVFDNLTPEVTVYQPAGTTSCAAPAASYRELGAVAAGQEVTLSFEFVRAGGATIVYAPRLLGAGVR